MDAQIGLHVSISNTPSLALCDINMVGLEETINMCKRVGDKNAVFTTYQVKMERAGAGNGGGEEGRRIRRERVTTMHSYGPQKETGRKNWEQISREKVGVCTDYISHATPAGGHGKQRCNIFLRR